MKDRLGRRELLAVLSGALLSACTPPQPSSSEPSPTAPQNAEAALEQERALAAVEGKGLLVIFFASWCPWCRRLDGTLAEPEARELIAPRFRIVHMRVREREPDMVAQQLDGAEALMTRLGAPGTGVPYFAFLDANGQVLASNVANGATIGFPVTDDELATFDAMLARSAPDMAETDRARLRAALVRHAPA